MPIQQASFYCPNCKQQKLFTRQGTSNLAHAVITLFLCGLWLPIWILISIGEGSKPYFCSNCGYANSPQNLANPLHAQQQAMAAQRRAELKALEPSFGEKAKVFFGKIEQITPYQWKIIVGITAFLCVAVVGLILFFKNQEEQNKLQAIQLKTYLENNNSQNDWLRQVRLVSVNNNSFEVRTYLSNKDIYASSICEKLLLYTFSDVNQTGIRRAVIYNINGSALFVLDNSNFDCETAKFQNTNSNSNNNANKSRKR